jgi:hypothetical protein
LDGARATKRGAAKALAKVRDLGPYRDPGDRLNDPGHGRPLHVVRAHSLLVILVLGACGSGSSRGPSNPPDEGGSGGSDEPTGGTGGSKPGNTGGKTGGTGGATGGSGATAGTGGGGPSGGSGGSTTTPDAAAPESDAAVDAAPMTTSDGAAPSAGCTAKFCDDFESYTPGMQPAGGWTVHLENKGALASDDKKAFSGARSVRFTHQGAPAAMFLELKAPVLPMAGNVVYGRLMYYLTKSPSGTYSHFEIVRGTGPLPTGTEGAQLNTGAENGKVVINYEPGDCTKYSKVAFPEKQWACYQFRFDGTKNDVHMWINGTSVDDVPVAPAGTCWKAPTAVDTLHIGWESYHGTMPVELWIDDVAVSDQPIPCPTGMPSKP